MQLSGGRSARASTGSIGTLLVVQLLTAERLEGGGYSTGDWRGRPNGEIVAPSKTFKRSCHGPDRR